MAGRVAALGRLAESYGIGGEYRGQYRVWLFALFKMTGIVLNLK